MRVIGRDGDFIHKTRSQPLDGPPRSVVVRIARNDYRLVERMHKRGRGRPETRNGDLEREDGTKPFDGSPGTIYFDEPE